MVGWGFGNELNYETPSTDIKKRLIIIFYRCCLLQGSIEDKWEKKSFKRSYSQVYSKTKKYENKEKRMRNSFIIKYEIDLYRLWL